MDQYSARMLILAAYCILRIFKSHLRERFDLSMAEEMFFKAIAMSKKRSIQNNDLDAINAKMLTQLWSSNTIFSRTDAPTNSLQIDLRGRLVSLSLGNSIYLTLIAVHERRLRLFLVVAEGVWRPLRF